MLNIYLPQSIYSDNNLERLIAADFIFKDDQIYMITALYPDFKFNLEDINLYAINNGLLNEIIKKEEPLGYIFNIEKILNFKVEEVYKLMYKNQFLERIKTQNIDYLSEVFLTAATLFKNDFLQLSAWISYHEKLGFQRFVIYYNGKISDILSEINFFKELFKYDILLIEWPFSYWVEGVELGIEGRLALEGDNINLADVQSQDWHHAQQLMLNHSLILLKDKTEYLGFFDLDEYYCVDGSTSIIDMIKNTDFDIYVYQSRWAELEINRIPIISDDFNFFKNKKTLVSEWIPIPSRSKYIGKPANIIQTGAHIPKQVIQGTKLASVNPDDIGIYHFHCFSGKASRREIINSPNSWEEGKKLV